MHVESCQTFVLHLGRLILALVVFRLGGVKNCGGEIIQRSLVVVEHHVAVASLEVRHGELSMLGARRGEVVECLLNLGLLSVLALAAALSLLDVLLLLLELLQNGFSSVVLLDTFLRQVHTSKTLGGTYRLFVVALVGLAWSGLIRLGLCGSCWLL